MKNADIFVIYDDAQFNKNDFQHRNKIRIYHGWKWLTVPIEKKRIPIKDIKIKNDFSKKGVLWNEAHLLDIKNNYQNSKFYKKYEKSLGEIYMDEYTNLIDLNMNIINFINNAFNISCKIVFSSEFGFTSKSTTRLAEITEALGGDVYLSGLSGKDYMDVSHFETRGIKIEYQNYKHPTYMQAYDGFVPNMSSIDALLNVENIDF